MKELPTQGAASLGSCLRWGRSSAQPEAHQEGFSTCVRLGGARHRERRKKQLQALLAPKSRGWKKQIPRVCC